MFGNETVRKLFFFLSPAIIALGPGAEPAGSQCSSDTTLYAYKGNEFTNFRDLMNPYSSPPLCGDDAPTPQHLQKCLGNTLNQSRLTGYVCLRVFPSHANQKNVRVGINDFSFTDGYRTTKASTLDRSAVPYLQFLFSFDADLNITGWNVVLPYGWPGGVGAGIYGPTVTSSYDAARPQDTRDVAEEDFGQLFPAGGMNATSNITAGVGTPGKWTGHPTCASLLTDAVSTRVKGPEMDGTFSPPGGLQFAASLCHVEHFNWQQRMNVLPAPNGWLRLGPAPESYLTAPPAIPDPPPPGLVDRREHSLDCNGKQLRVAASVDDIAYPFYWSAAELQANSSTNELKIWDVPTDPCLSGNDPRSNPGAHIEFTTTLVGVDTGGNPVNLPVTNTWDWLSTYNGTAGGTSALKNLQPVDAGSGTGGVDVLSINGISLRGPCASNATSQIAVKGGGYGFSMATGRFTQTVTLTNTSGAAIGGPISLALDNLSNGISLYNASGSTNCATPIGSSYTTANVDLAVGQSVRLTVQFTDPARTAISYIPRVLAGPAAR